MSREDASNIAAALRLLGWETRIGTDADGFHVKVIRRLP